MILDKYIAYKDKNILLLWAIFFIFLFFLILLSISFEVGILIISSLLLLIILYFYPIFGIFIISILYPLYLWFLDVNNFFSWHIRIPYVDLFGLFLLFSFILLYGIKFFKKGVDAFKKLSFPGVVIMLIFLLSGIISSLYSYNFVSSLKYLLRPILFGYLVFFILPLNIIKNKRDLLAVLILNYFVSLVIVFLSLVSLLWTGSSLMDGFVRIKPFNLGGWAPMGLNHNLIAEYLVPLLPLFFLLFLWIKDIFYKKIIILSSILYVIIILLTLSRAGWLAIFLEFIFALLGFRLLSKKHNNKGKGVLGGILLIIILPLSLYFGYFLTSKIVSVSDANRLLMLETARRVYNESAWWGLGPGTFQSSVRTHTDYLRIFGEPLDAHGLLIKLISEVGIVGTLSFYSLLFYLFYRIIRIYLQSKTIEKKYVVLLVFLSFLGNFIFQQFNTSYFIAKFWFPLSIGFASLRVLLKEEYKILV